VRREYDHLVTLMRQMPGVATVVDVVQLELAAAALAEYRTAVAVVLRRGQTYECKTQAGAVMVRTRPQVAIAADAWRRAHAALQVLGLSPTSRPRVEGDAPSLHSAHDRLDARERRAGVDPHDVLSARRRARAAAAVAGVSPA
jgi:P27 family predicted phage terminase small subunit